MNARLSSCRKGAGKYRDIRFVFTFDSCEAVFANDGNRRNLATFLCCDRVTLLLVYLLCILNRVIHQI